MEKLENAAKGFTRTKTEESLLNNYMKLDRTSYDSCETCNNCGSGNCNSCCNDTDSGDLD